MDRHNIITLPDKRLRQKSLPVKKAEPGLDGLIKDMQAATLDWEDHRQNEVGVALAAVQVGKLKQVVIIRADFENRENREFRVYLNPKIIKQGGRLVSEPEGCLSVPDIYGLVPRYSQATIRALDAAGQPVTLQTEGFLARVFQHELDHNHGALFIDKVEAGRFFRLDINGELKPLSDEAVAKNPLLRQR